MKNNILRLISSISIILSVTSCGTVFSGTTQPIHIKAIDVANNADLEGARCVVLAGDSASYTVATNPGIVTVKRGAGDLQVTCKKEGYKQSTVLVGDSFNVVTLVNVIFWPGALVDLATGAYKKYPSHYLVHMEKISAPT